jgi:TPR repeat protein
VWQQLVSANWFRVAGVLVTLTCVPEAVPACGWSGDGEMILFGKADISFIPRGNSVTTDPSEMARLSAAYRLGVGVEANRETALLWARRAAAAGHAGAMNDLAYMYETGFVGEADLAGALFWFRKSAELGIPAAQHSLAEMLREGRGVEKDIAQADILLREAAQGGHASASADLAELLWRGEIEEILPDEACFQWLVAVAGDHEGEPERCLSENPDMSEDRFETLNAMARLRLVPLK